MTTNTPLAQLAAHSHLATAITVPFYFMAVVGLHLTPV